MKILVDQNNEIWRMEGQYTPYLTSRLPLLKIEQDDPMSKSTLNENGKRLYIPADMIMDSIIMYCIHDSIKKARFGKAQQLMFLNRRLVQLNYTKYVTDIQPNIFTMDWSGNPRCIVIHLKRLSSTLQYLDAIFNQVLLTQNPNRFETFYFDQYAEMEDTNYAFPCKVYDGYTFEVLEMTEVVQMGEDDLNQHFKFVCAGLRYCDVVWLTGTLEPDQYGMIHSDSGLFNAETIEYPVIVLCVHEGPGNFLSAKTARSYLAWQKFINVLKFVGGSNTGVYFIENVENDDYYINKF